MQKISCSVTVFFEDPFWVAVYERREDHRLEVCRIVFGPEPKDCAVYEFLLSHWGALSFSPPVRDSAGPKAAANPKRMQRRIKRQLAQPGVSTKAQQAIKLQQAEGKQARRRKSREEREREQLLRFARRQEQKRQKHRGR